MKELIGRTVKELFINEDQSLLKFTLDDGEEFLIYETEGDCCSESWFADILLGYRFFGSKIEEVKDLDVPDWVCNLLTKDGRTRQEYDQVYGYQLIFTNSNGPRFGTNKSNCDIIFRNSSNGYYGGWCQLMDQNTRWSIKKLDEATWTQITEDWQA